MIDIKDYPIVEIEIDKIKKDPTNPNVMSLEQSRGLEKSMIDFGRLSHIVVDQNNVLIDGEHRYEVEQALGTQKVQVIQVTIKDEIERKMMRETLNKLHGKYDPYKESAELLAIFQNQKLNELSDLLGKPNLEDFRQLISRYQSVDIFNTNDDPNNEYSLTNSLAKKYGLPPFTILEVWSQRWQERKRKWLDFGLATASQGRENVRYWNTNLFANASLPSVSLYDPVLCEIMYRWFTPFANCKVLDPFAGGITRGLIASFLGHEYHGIDLSQKQIDANEEQYEKLKHRMPMGHVKPNWYQGDSLDIDTVIPIQNGEKFNMLQTSPPYFLQEIYSKDQRDLNQIKTFDLFLDKYLQIIDKCCDLLTEKNSFAVWNTTNTRDKNTGEVTNIIFEITNQFRKHGFILLNDVILVRPIGSLQMMAPRHFKKRRYLGQRHENVLVYYRGSIEEIPEIDPNVTATDVLAESELELEFGNV